jgi:hypothetical protein
MIDCSPVAVIPGHQPENVVTVRIANLYICYVIRYSMLEFIN